MNKLNNKKGISLIVLVITIIVMIILAAAIILSLQSSGIIGKANEAKTASDIANKKQAATVALSEYELAKQLGETTKTATKFVQDKLNEQGIDYSNVLVDEYNNVIVGSGASAINKGVALGEYVDYIPKEEKSTKYKVCVPGTKSEVENKFFSTQEELKWRYMGINENGAAMLISDVPTEDGLYLSGADGYLNGPSKLNNLCKELYSNITLGEARSINVEDVNRLLNAKPVGKYVSSNGEQNENTLQLSIGEIILEKGEIPLSNVNSPDSRNINDYVPNWYTYNGSDYKPSNSSEYKLIFKKIIMDDGVETEINAEYWLSSSCVIAFFDGSYANFRMRYINGVSVMHYNMFQSFDAIEGIGYSVRPVIILNSNVQFGAKSETGVWSIYSE